MMNGSSLRLKERLGLSGPVRGEAEGSEVEQVLGSVKPSVRVAPDPEVSSVSGRRRFSAVYKARIVGEADACVEPGEGRGALAAGGVVFLESDPLAQAELIIEFQKNLCEILGISQARVSTEGER